MDFADHLKAIFDTIITSAPVMFALLFALAAFIVQFVSNYNAQMPA